VETSLTRHSNEGLLCSQSGAHASQERLRHVVIQISMTTSLRPSPGRRAGRPSRRAPSPGNQATHRELRARLTCCRASSGPHLNPAPAGTSPAQHPCEFALPSQRRALECHAGAPTPSPSPGRRAGHPSRRAAGDQAAHRQTVPGSASAALPTARPEPSPRRRRVLLL
jgi:hypothetical protein